MTCEKRFLMEIELPALYIYPEDYGSSRPNGLIAPMPARMVGRAIGLQTPRTTRSLSKANFRLIYDHKMRGSRIFCCQQYRGHNRSQCIHSPGAWQGGHDVFILVVSVSGSCVCCVCNIMFFQRDSRFSREPDGS